MINKLLDRLRKVQSRGHGQYMACCPAHEDRTPSLSIRDAGDGRILVNCLAGCSTEDVLSSIGLEFKDITPPNTIAHHMKPVKPRVYATDALKALEFEARIVQLAAYEMSNGKKLDEQDSDRLKLAIERIETALEIANG